MGMPPNGLRAVLRGVVLFLASGSVHGEELLWPLPLNPALSSTFGESRSTAFHMGIDLKTWGKTGFEVRAPGDGYVMRLKTSPWGYGRALYLKLSDGRILVFAHLSEFERRIADRVEQVQEEGERYSVDIWLEAEELAVGRGDLIARTGDSGAGPPHLHLELRDANNVALNPLANGFLVPDTVAPTIRGVALIPVDSESTVDGGHQPVTVALRWNATRGQFESDQIPSVFGRVGIGILEYDRMDATSNKLASHQLKLMVDGKQRFACRYDRVSYAEQHQIFLDRTALSLESGKRNFSNLFLRPGNRLKFYDRAANRGLLHCGVAPNALAQGEHSLRLIVEDISGNSSRADLRFRVNASPEILTTRMNEGDGARSVEVELGDDDNSHLRLTLDHSADGGSWSQVSEEKVPLGLSSLPLPARNGIFRLTAADDHGGEAMATIATRVASQPSSPELSLTSSSYAGGVDLTIRTSQILAEAPRVIVDVRGRVFDTVARQQDLLTYRTQIPLEFESTPATSTVRISAIGRNGSRGEVSAEFNLQALQPETVGRLRFASALLTVPQAAVYERFIPQVVAFDPATDGELVDTGIGYEFEPEGTSFDRKVNLQISYTSSTVEPSKLGIYREVSVGRWAMIGNQLNREAATIGCDIRRFSRFALLADLTAPTIIEVHPANGETVRARKPHLWFRFKEEGSGIAEEDDVEIRLDGRRVISELDPDASTASFLVRENLSPGKHRLAVRIVDASGNESSTATEFVVE